MEFKGPDKEGMFLSCWKLEVEGKKVGPKIVLEISVDNFDGKMMQS